MSSVHAELYTVDVTSKTTGKPSETNLEGLSLFLVDVSHEKALISGLLKVSKEVGPIESCRLVVNQPDGTTIAQTFMTMQELPDGDRVFEFDLTRPVIEKSHLFISLRTGEDLGIARVLLGTFTIHDPKAKK